MRAELITSEQQVVKENTMSNPTSGLALHPLSCVTAEYLVINKKMIWSDKLHLCERSSQTQKSSKTSVQDSISREKGLERWWSEQSKERSSKLWLPIETDLQGSGSICLSGFSNEMMGKSWFSASLYFHQSKSSQKTYLPSCMYSQQDFTVSEVTKARLRKIYPTPLQKIIFKEWSDVARYVYNKTVELLNSQPDGARTPSEMMFSTFVLKLLPRWCDDTPYQIKKIAVKDAIRALKQGKTRVKKGMIPRFSLGFKSRKNPKQSFYVPKSAIKRGGIYPTKTDSGLRWSEKIPDKPMDSRLIIQNGEYYIAIPEKFKTAPSESQAGTVVSIDPGIRTFNTFYSGDFVGKIGQGDFSRIQRMATHLDDLISRASKCGTQKKRRMMRAANRMRKKVKNLIDELHHKAALFYVTMFDTILLPSFETSQMVLKAGRKIRNKTVRNMLSFSFYRFAQFLKHKALEHGKQVIMVTEEYTSKTHPRTGELRNIGGSKRLKIDKNTYCDRDIVGAFNIMLKALGDFPDKIKLVAVA